MYAQGHEPLILMGAKNTIKKQIPLVMVFVPWLFDHGWKKKFLFLTRNYNYYYDLKKEEKKKNFSLKELDLLVDEYCINNNYTDLLIF